MPQSIQRRQFLWLTGLAAMVAAGLVPLCHLWADTIAKINKSNDEWRKILNTEQYDILRNEGTEHPFTSPLLNEHREGIFSCVACDLALFTSDKKFDSGTGWPSFFEAIPGHIETKTDHSLFMERTEYHCARCGGHHGHLFNDGPAPTGLRHCSNGAVLKFTPKGA